MTHIVRGFLVSLNSNPVLLNLYLAHRSALLNYATRIVGSRVWAEDIVQEAYLRIASMSPNDQLVLGSDRQSEIAHPVAYLYRIVRNLAADWSRRRSTENTEPAYAEVIDAMAAQAPSPEHELIYRQQVRLLADALKELPERTQIAFAMHRLGGYTLQAIAEHLGISVTLAHQLVRSALTHCADRLDELPS
jgi:RNA polymerase sigma-70 factor (ECF subfamily)